MLEVRDLSAGYGDVRVLHDVSFEVGKGEVVALLGPNGHGKSTLLRAIAGIHPATSGSVIFDGQDVTRAPAHQIVEKGLAYIAEERHLFTDMTVRENLRLGAYPKRARGKERENLEIVHRVFPRLADRREQRSSTMSGGEARMLAIARGMMSNASMLLIDEPSIGLAPGLKKDVYDSIRQVNAEAGVTVLLVEQEIEHALALANRVYLLRRGRLEDHGVADEVAPETVRKAYF